MKSRLNIIIFIALWTYIFSYILFAPYVYKNIYSEAPIYIPVIIITFFESTVFLQNHFIVSVLLYILGLIIWTHFSNKFYTKVKRKRIFWGLYVMGCGFIGLILVLTMSYPFLFCVPR